MTLKFAIDLPRQVITVCARELSLQSLNVIFVDVAGGELKVVGGAMINPDVPWGPELQSALLTRLRGVPEADAFLNSLTVPGREPPFTEEELYRAFLLITDSAQAELLARSPTTASGEEVQLSDDTLLLLSLVSNELEKRVTLYRQAQLTGARLGWVENYMASNKADAAAAESAWRQHVSSEEREWERRREEMKRIIRE